MGDLRGSTARGGPGPVGALAVASVLWGTTGTAASLMPADVGPLAIGACTMAVGGAALFLVSARRSAAAIRDPRARVWLLIGAVGVFAYPLSFYTGMQLAGVAIGNVVALGSGPVFAALYEWFVQRRGLSARWLVATVIAVAGVALLGIAGHPHTSAGSAVGRGVLLALVAGAAYALYAYASTRALEYYGSGRAVMGGMFGLGAIPLIPVLIVTGLPLLQSASSLGVAAYLVVGPMAIAYLLFGYGIGSLRSSVATTITLIEPVVATVLAVTVVGERLTVAGWIGLALILIGVLVTATARQPRIRPEGF